MGIFQEVILLIDRKVADMWVVAGVQHQRIVHFDPGAGVDRDNLPGPARPARIFQDALVAEAKLGAAILVEGDGCVIPDVITGTRGFSWMIVAV